jgi:hypothetical protein
VTGEEMKDLNVGDLVCHVHESEVYVVTANYGSRITAVKTVDLTNPMEWCAVRRALAFSHTPNFRRVVSK